MKTMNIEIGGVLENHLDEQFSVKDLCEWMLMAGHKIAQGNARGYLNRFKDSGIVTSLGKIRKGSYAWALFTINQAGIDALNEFNEREKEQRLLNIQAGALKRSCSPKKKPKGTVWSKHSLMSGKPGTTSIMMGAE